MSLRGAQALRSVVSLLVVLAAAGIDLWTLEASSAATGRSSEMPLPYIPQVRR